MTEKLRTTWRAVQPALKKYWWAVLVGTVFIALIGWAEYARRAGLVWADWTGFGSYMVTDEKSQRGKTLWDWMQLLFVPIVLALGVWILNRSQSNSDHAIALDNQRQIIYDTYLNHIAEFIIESENGISKDNIRLALIARARTLSALRNLDVKRKGDLIHFLYETNLIKVDSKKIDLAHAPLNGAQRAWSNLGKVDLARAFLNKADFKWAHLQGADLSDAELVEANLFDSDLQNVNFQKANLSKANLIKANLEGASLEEANFSGANLENANVRNEQLAKSKSLEGAIMPDGRMFDPAIHTFWKGPSADTGEQIGENH